MASNGGGHLSRLKVQWKVLLTVFIGIQLAVYHFYIGANPRTTSKPNFRPSRRECSGMEQARESLLPVATGSGWWEPPESSQNVTVAKYTSWRYGVVTQLGPPMTRDCLKLRSDPRTEVERVNLIAQVQSWRCSRSWEKYALRFKTENCTEIAQEFSNLFYVSEVEKEFPIAYILVVYTNPGQVLRFLKSIYRPHNLYCIHPDARQGQEFSDYFKAVANCIDNIFIVSKPVKVIYRHISYLDSQLHCMQDLMEYPASSWKYVINLCGRELPLKTNREIVEILMKLNGSSALHVEKMSSAFLNHRVAHKYYFDKKGNSYGSYLRQGKPPKGIKLYKSLTFMAASRQFVDFILNDPLAIEFHKYVAPTLTPDEHYYASLYALPQAKGARPNMKQSDIPYISGVLWMYSPQAKCPGGQIVHSICVVTALDLHLVEKQSVRSRLPVLFFNKYFLEVDPTPMDCMEERLVRTNMEEYSRDCNCSIYVPVNQ